MEDMVAAISSELQDQQVSGGIAIDTRRAKALNRDPSGKWLCRLWEWDESTERFVPTDEHVLAGDDREICVAGLDVVLVGVNGGEWIVGGSLDSDDCPPWFK